MVSFTPFSIGYGNLVLCFSFCCVVSTSVVADELSVGKVCPVMEKFNSLGTLIVSTPWYHASRSRAAYQAMDDATGIGVEIHFFANEQGDVRYANQAHCDRYRLLQTRKTNARLLPGDQWLQIDVPASLEQPFSDQSPLEFGRGSHLTPLDDRDKPWSGQVGRASTVAIYDTPYISDAFGIEGRDMFVKFETCAVCERDNQYDSILSCVEWGYRREYMGGMTGWAEPELTPLVCHNKPQAEFKKALDESNDVLYSYWLDWR